MILGNLGFSLGFFFGGFFWWVGKDAGWKRRRAYLETLKRARIFDDVLIPHFHSETMLLAPFVEMPFREKRGFSVVSKFSSCCRHSMIICT